MSITCRTYFLVVEQQPDQADDGSVRQYSCAGILQDCALKISLFYAHAGPPFVLGAILYVEGAFIMFAGFCAVFAETAEDLNCPHPTNGALIPFRPRLWFDGFLVNVEAYMDIDGQQVLVLDVFVEGPVAATVRFLRSRHLIPLLPVLYLKHKLTLCGDICGSSGSDIVDIDIFNINYVVYPSCMAICKVLYEPVGNDAKAPIFVGAATTASNPPEPAMKSIHTNHLTVYDLNPAETPIPERSTSDPISEVMEGAVEVAGKDMPFKVYGWSPKGKTTTKPKLAIDAQRPEVFKTHTLSL